MKQYGAKKATEFTRKQIGVIFRNAKNGSLKVEKWIMSRMYDLADFYGFDDNGNVAREEQNILHILENIFAGDLETAQEQIDAYTAQTFDRFTVKYQKAFNRAFVA